MNAFVKSCWMMLLCVFVSTAFAEEPYSYDHHVHILSPKLIQDWKGLGVPFSRPDTAYSDASAIAADNKLKGACLISMAHLYSMEDFHSITEQGVKEQALVAAENDYIASCVAAAPQRFIGFFSINPLRPYAMEELRRCTLERKMQGVKLHVPACGIDIDNAAHLARLHAVLAWAAEHGQIVLIHFSSGEEISFDRGLQFWKSVVVPHPKLKLILAHGGATGGFNDSTGNILTAWRDIKKGAESGHSLPTVYFEMSALVFDSTAEEFTETKVEDAVRLTALIESIGVDSFLFGSDYPVFGIQATRQYLHTKLKLNPADKQRIEANRLPLFNSCP